VNFIVTTAALVRVEVGATVGARDVGAIEGEAVGELVGDFVEPAVGARVGSDCRTAQSPPLQLLV